MSKLNLDSDLCRAIMLGALLGKITFKDASILLEGLAGLDPSVFAEIFAGVKERYELNENQRQSTAFNTRKAPDVR